MAESYFISTPYIDAYDHDWEPGRPKIDYGTFVQKMKSQAYSWGEQGVGRAVISALEPAMHDGRNVLAFGSHGDKRYVAVPKQDGSWGVEVIEVETLPNEWDVT